MENLQVRFVESYQGKKLAIVEGYIFQRDYQKDDGTWYGRCASSKVTHCYARTVVKGYPDNNPIATVNGIHNHGRQDVSIWRREAVATAKKLCQEQPTASTNEIISQVQMIVVDPYGIASSSSQYKNLEKVIRRQRAKCKVKTKPSLKERRLMEFQRLQQFQTPELKAAAATVVNCPEQISSDQPQCSSSQQQLF